MIGKLSQDRTNGSIIHSKFPTQHLDAGLLHGLSRKGNHLLLHVGVVSIVLDRRIEGQLGGLVISFSRLQDSNESMVLPRRLLVTVLQVHVEPTREDRIDQGLDSARVMVPPASVHVRPEVDD